MGEPKRKRRHSPPPAERLFKPHPDDEADVRAGLEEVERGKGVVLTTEQLQRWVDTGELECLESSSSRRGS